MTTDFRALCGELLREFEHATHDDYQQQLKNSIRAALAKSQPRPPTDEELTLTYALAVAAAVDGMTKPWPADLCERAQLAGLRAVLARWGNS